MKILELLDCPFCGARACDLDKGNGKGVYVYLDSPGKGHDSTRQVACLECGSGNPNVKLWNTRKANGVTTKLKQK